MIHEAESILIIITSVTLFGFLVAGIVVLVLFAKLLRAIQRMVEHAEQLVETASEAAEMLRNASGPLAAFKVVRNILRAMDGMRHEPKKKERV